MSRQRKVSASRHKETALFILGFSGGSLRNKQGGSVFGSENFPGNLIEAKGGTKRLWAGMCLGGTHKTPMPPGGCAHRPCQARPYVTWCARTGCCLGREVAPGMWSAPRTTTAGYPVTSPVSSSVRRRARPAPRPRRTLPGHRHMGARAAGQAGADVPGQSPALGIPRTLSGWPRRVPERPV